MVYSCDAPVLSKPASVMGEYYYTQEEFCECMLENFKHNLRDYDVNPAKALQQAREIGKKNMKISGRYFCRPLDALLKPSTPQQQADLCVSIGLPMIVSAVEQALQNAGISSKEVSAVIFTSHIPFPFPPLSTHVMNTLDFKKDCVNIPCLSMGCAGGGYALRTARDYLTAHPDQAVLIVNFELCSLGFRPHKSGMSWYLNTALFGDAVAAAVVRGAFFEGGRGDGMQIVLGKQRHVQDTTGVSFFTYDECGYHFITTQSLCDVAESTCPQFARDLAMEAFGLEPRDLKLAIIHPGGARMISAIGGQLGLEDTFSARLAWRSMDKLGNVASATITDMIAMAWDELQQRDEAIVVGMGPGFVLDGVSLRYVSERSLQKRRSASKLALSLLTRAVLSAGRFMAIAARLH
eukprot:TRINITY_DN3083_c0_g1_i1.p1 TRINITY_DN3083_c0_g1~~TRINITY_DN3083_c0_g1_i1.p1  ORF type:complete len:407 (-),score=77.15 TRINITY_DN3083_c0_g1_i1:339-1559(-)